MPRLWTPSARDGYGTLAARPAAGAQGRRYYAFDDNGGTEYLDSGSAWVPLNLAGKLVANGEATITSSFVYSTDNNPTDITGLTITFTPLQAAVVIRLGGWFVQQNTTGSSPEVRLCDSANVDYAQAFEQCVTGALIWSMPTIEAKVNLTPGTSYTFKGRAKRGLAGASTVTLGAATTDPFWIRAFYC